MANEGHVKKLKEGVVSWNEWRQTRPSHTIVDLRDANLQGWNLDNAKLRFAKLQGADLRRAKLQGADLRNVDLQGSKLDDAKLQRANLELTKFQGCNFGNCNLQEANLGGAELQGTDLRGVNLQEANLGGAELQGTDLRGVNLQKAILYKAKLQGADLRGAKLQGAELCEANFTGAELRNANLQGADLQNAHGIRLDNTLIKDAHFSPRASDPWSLLRRKYTGQNFIFHLLGLIAFALPYIGKIGFWSFVNRGQEYTQGLLETIRQRAQEQGIDDQAIAALGLSPEKITSLSQCLSELCDNPRPVWQLLLGLDQNGLFWLLPVTLIVYNILRGVLTYFIGPMREEEERSGYSPAWMGERKDTRGIIPPLNYTRWQWQIYGILWPYFKSWWQGYRFLHYVHRGVSILFFIAVVAFLLNAWHWLSQPIYLPA